MTDGALNVGTDNNKCWGCICAGKRFQILLIDSL